MATNSSNVHRCFIGLLWVYLTLVRKNGHGCNIDENVTYIAENLIVNYTVIKNDYPYLNDGKNYFQGQFNLTNNGSQPITNGNWAIFFSYIRMIEPDLIKPNGTVLEKSGLRVHHGPGTVFWLEPTTEFSNLNSSDTLSVNFIASDWMVARTDMMPNWYAVSRGVDCNDSRVILSTIGEDLSYVSPFNMPEQWKRVATDKYDPYTAEVRFDKDKVTDRGIAVRNILPTPFFENYTEILINPEAENFLVVIPDDPSIQKEATILSVKLGLGMVSSSDAPDKNIVTLTVGRVIHDISGACEIQINSTQIAITGFDPVGVFYGVQSLISLVETTDNGTIPTGVVKDYPRFEHRGLHIDVSRNFHSVDDLKLLMDAMAMYKLNRLHLHLGNDEGWRLEIPSIPELTEVGSNRCHDLSGTQCIMPQLGSIPTLPNNASGYYSGQDYKDILTYARDQHITLIPEFDMPGHAHAAVNSMLARYRRYNGTDSVNATKYLLTDLEDKSVYSSSQYFDDNAINPCVNSTYNFIETVLQTVMDLHQEIQPLTLYHIGGDEVPVGAWLQSPICQKQFGEHVTQGQVKRYFLQRINEIVNRLNVIPVAWEDGLTLDKEVVNRTELFSGDVVVNAWDNVGDWGTQGQAYEFANADYKVVLNHATHLFFDFPAEPDPEERGYYWATRTIPLNKTFSYMPDDVYGNMDMDVDRMGYPLNKTAICLQSPCPALDPGKASNIIGMQAQAWSETIGTPDQLHNAIFPRLLALAERSWHKADWENIEDLEERKGELDEDWEAFANTLGYKELRRLDKMGIKYRIPLVGAKNIAESEIQLTSGLPGLPIEYRNATQDSQWTSVPGTSLILNSTVNLTHLNSEHGQRIAAINATQECRAFQSM